MKPTEIIGNCHLYLGDCREILPTLPKVDLVLTDPPYGIDFGNFNRTNAKADGKREKANKYHNGDWDKGFVLDSYFEQFKSISEKFIIWGGNYFPCLWTEPQKSILFWNKKQPCENFSAGELAWSNIGTPARHIDFAYFGNIEGNTSASEKNHPTQKPVRVIEWCIDLAPKNTQTIADPFMGSGTTGVACANMGKTFYGIEREPKYFDIACKRIEQAYAQMRLFA